MMEQFDSMGVLGHFSLCLYLCTMHLSLIWSLLWSMESRHRAKADVCVSKQRAQSEDEIPCSIAMTISMINAWYIGKDIRKNVLVPYAIKLLHHIEKCVISNKAINMHSRGPTKQYFYVWEPHRGYFHKVKKVFWYPPLKRANGAINMHCTLRYET